jgi:hypothetical protein
MTLARWLYVNEARTHEVHAGLRTGGAGHGEFVVKESAYHNDDPEEAYESATPLHEAWEAQLQLMQLENRLALLGAYWRNDVLQPGWTKLRPERFASLDLRPVRTQDAFEGRVAFYHFHKKGSEDVTLLTIPTQTPRGVRYLLAQATFTFPHADEGDLRYVHPRLTPEVAVSLLAREHARRRDEGYERLYGGPDLLLAHGKEWQREVRYAYEAMLQRISEGRLGLGRSKDDRPRVVDDLYTDYLQNLNDPRLIALHARFLTPEEEKRALDEGERGIKRLIAQKRQAVNSTQENVLLTILEASLLARDGLRAGQPTHVDPEVAALVRRFAYYL